MSRKELPRAGLVAAALAGRISNQDGAVALGITARQFQCLKQRYREGGGPALRHQGRERLSHRRLPASTTVQVQALLGGRYKGFNDTHATEKLLEVEHIAISRESVRRLRRALGLPAVHRRRPPQHRSRRPREPAAGQLVQLAGSPFDWLQSRGPAMTLLGAIDDATSQVVALHFRPTEDLHGYATVLRQMFTTGGLPVALYGDGINILVRNDRHWTLEEQLAGIQAPTHLGRVLQDLGIGYVQALPTRQGPSGAALGHAARPTRQRAAAARHRHARGRQRLPADVPRRLQSPLRAGAGTAPAVWRRPPRDLAVVLSCRYARVVARDNTVRLGPRLIQIPPGPHGRSYARRRVEVRELLDGRLVVCADGIVIATGASPGPDFALVARRAPGEDRRRAPSRPPSIRTALQHLTTALPRRPAARHPWRRAYDPLLAERAGYPQHRG